MEWQRVEETLRRDFGLSYVRPHQRAIVDRVLAGIDTLGILPTGSGKSLTYQLPAMLLPGVTLVVSPLIALMKDQVEGAPAAIRNRLAYLSSGQTFEQQLAILDRVRAGQVKLLYVAPERLAYRSLRSAVEQAGVSLFVVDEAHSVSYWGNDFRPVYRLLAKAHTGYGRPTVLALTATAPPDVVEDIVYALGRHLDIVSEGTDRPNLHYAVEQVANAEARKARTLALALEWSGSGIVFAPSRKMVDELAAALRQAGVTAAPYHAGLSKHMRDANQQAYMTDRVRVMVATVAFGMGIDTQDVRWVLHAGPPTTIAGYAQETGRAGRDGKPARCVLLTTPRDPETLHTKVASDIPTAQLLERVLMLAGQGRSSGWAPVDHDALKQALQSGGGAEGVDPEVVLGYLTQAQVVERTLDAPREFVMTRRVARGPAPRRDDPAERLWEGALALMGPGWAAQGQAWLDPVAACERLQLDPGRLYSLLWERPDVQLESGRRHVAWYRMRGLTRADRERVYEDLIEKMRWQRGQRVERMMEYIAGRECRHVLLARAFHGRLDPCGTQCDVCRPVGAAPPPAAYSAAHDMPTRHAEPPSQPPAQPSRPPQEELADPLYDRLVQWRKERAARDRVQASAVATTQQLEAIARARPATAADLRRLAGMPAGWVERYGAEVLALVTGRA